jgi:hypothetical protein
MRCATYLGALQRTNPAQRGMTSYVLYRRRGIGWSRGPFLSRSAFDLGFRSD